MILFKGVTRAEPITEAFQNTAPPSHCTTVYASTLFIQTTIPSGELNRTSVKSALTTPHNEPGANTGKQTLSNKPTEHDETLTNTSPDRFAAKQYSTSNNISRPNTNNYTTKTQPTDKLNNAHNHTMAKNSTRQIPRTKLNLSIHVCLSLV